MLAKLKYSVDEEVQALMPEAVEIARKKKLERLQQLVSCFRDLACIDHL